VCERERARGREIAAHIIVCECAYIRKYTHTRKAMEKNHVSNDIDTIISQYTQ